MSPRCNCGFVSFIELFKTINSWCEPDGEILIHQRPVAEPSVRRREAGDTGQLTAHSHSGPHEKGAGHFSQRIIANYK